jgi:hypothetical protein
MNRKDRRAAHKSDVRADQAAPRTLDALMNEANELFQRGDPVRAQSVCELILARMSGHAAALNLLGVIYRAAERPKRALSALEKAASVDPRNATVQFNLADCYQALQQEERAELHLSKAITLGLNGRHAEDFIIDSKAIAGCVRCIQDNWPLPAREDLLFAGDAVERIADDLFLRAALKATLVRGVVLEPFLTRLRATLLRRVERATTGDGEVAASSARLFCALAWQCFVNEYVFAIGNDERDIVTRLTAVLQRQLVAGNGITPGLLAAVAAYQPLNSLAFADQVLRRQWPHDAAALVRQQIVEPREEESIRATIPTLASVDDRVSRQVQEQYEENPYPRWTMSSYEAGAGDSGPDARPIFSLRGAARANTRLRWPSAFRAPAFSPSMSAGQASPMR